MQVLLECISDLGILVRCLLPTPVGWFNWYIYAETVTIFSILSNNLDNFIEFYAFTKYEKLKI
jgi:hypothetical protein